MGNDPEKRLLQAAKAQQGYFTSKQAIAAGYRMSNHPYHVKNGDWTREYRGIYRLASFPNSPDDHYMLWSLWSGNRTGNLQGVYSFETALNIYEVSDVMPAKIHMTVPQSFRRGSAIPDVLVLHKENLQEKDFREIKGFRVTTPLKTILNLLEDNEIEEKIIKQAVTEFYERGLLVQKDLLVIIEKRPSIAKLFIGKNKRVDTNE